MNFTLLIAFGIAFHARQCEAWCLNKENHCHQHHPSQGLDQRRHRLLTTRSMKSSLNSNNDDHDSSSVSSSIFPSRRQWLTGMTSAAVMVGGGGGGNGGGISLPANAADLVSAKSICDPSVSVWKKDGRLVYILGTAHISSASAVLAGDLVKDIHPKGVFVELDPKRIKGSGVLASRVQNQDGNNDDDDDQQQPKSRIVVPNIQISSTDAAGMATAAVAQASSSSSSNAVSTVNISINAKNNNNNNNNPVMKAATKAVGNSIRGMYKKLDSAGFQAGEEFVVAIQEGQAIGSDIVLGDRDVEVTLQRVTEGLSRTDLKALLNPDSELEQSLKELVPSKVSSSPNLNADLDLSNEEFREEFTSFVETMKAKENVRKIMTELQRVAPALYEALVSERDAYMAAGLNGLDELETIVAVMGIAHVDGVEQNLMINGWKAIQPTCSVK